MRIQALLYYYYTVVCGVSSSSISHFCLFPPFTAFLLSLKKVATHSHFASIFSVIVCLFVAPQYVWPHGLGITLTTFIAAFTIPPFGMMDSDSFKKADKLQEDGTKSKSKVGKDKKKK
jgi:hypothetical protein